MKSLRPITITLAAAAALMSGLPGLAAGTSDLTTTKVIASQPACAVQTSSRQQFRLSTEQLEKLHSLKLQFDANNAGKIAQLKVLKEQLKDSLSQPTVDKSAALAMQSRINGLRDELATARISEKADASTIFTPEQRENFRRHMLMRDSMAGHHKFAHRFASNRLGQKKGGMRVS